MSPSPLTEGSESSRHNDLSKNPTTTDAAEDTTTVASGNVTKVSESTKTPTPGAGEQKSRKTTLKRPCPSTNTPPSKIARPAAPSGKNGQNAPTQGSKIVYTSELPTSFTLANDNAQPKKRKNLAHYTPDQVRWLINSSSEMPDRTLASWNNLAFAYKTRFGENRPAYSLRIKVKRLEESMIEKRDVGKQTAEAEGSGVDAGNVEEVRQTKDNTFDHLSRCLEQQQQLVQSTNTANINEKDPMPVHEGWLRKNVHKFQNASYEVNWLILADLFADIFKAKVSPQSLENMWNQIVCSQGNFIYE